MEVVPRPTVEYFGEVSNPRLRALTPPVSPARYVALHRDDGDSRKMLAMLDEWERDSTTAVDRDAVA